MGPMGPGGPPPPYEIDYGCEEKDKDMKTDENSAQEIEDEPS